MIRACSRFLIFTIGISIALFPLMEVGHQFLHSFDNGLHHHAKAHHYHTISEHKVNQSLPTAEATEEGAGHNFISLLFGLSIPVQPELKDLKFGDAVHATMFVCIYNSISTRPLTPPPLG